MPQAFVGGIPHFFDLLSQQDTGIPIQSQWVLLFHGFPKDLISQVTQYEEYLRIDRSTSWRNVSMFVDHQTADPLQRIKGCIFAQKINSPTEEIDYARVGENIYRGGYVRGPTTTSRRDFSTFNVSFLETNLSFADMVLRPWIIMTAHKGLMARESDTGQQRTPASTVNGIKANMSVYHLAKAGYGVPPTVRKLFNYYDCVPVSISTEDYTYIGDEIKLRDVNFLYAYYTADADPQIVDTGF